MKLIIIRHGETIENLKSILTGQTPGQLSEKGVKQAKLVAKHLKDEKIDFIYCSDLQRTRDTLAEILKLQQKPVIYDPLLREKTQGIFDGGPAEEYRKVRDLHRQNARWRAPKGENFYDVKKRVRQFIHYLETKHNQNDTILIITHGGWKTIFFSYLMDIPREKVFYLKFGNTAISEVELCENGRHKVHRINCTKHLDKEA